MSGTLLTVFVLEHVHVTALQTERAEDRVTVIRTGRCVGGAHANLGERVV